MRDDSGVAGEGRVVDIPKFHSWGKCTMSLTNINSEWMSKASSGLCIILFILYYVDPLNPRQIKLPVLYAHRIQITRLYLKYNALYYIATT